MPHFAKPFCLFYVFWVLILTGCSAVPPVTPAALRLYVLDCGSIDASDISMFQPDVGQKASKTFSDACYLVVHPKGTLLWDAGLPDALAKTPEGRKFMEVFVLRSTQTLAAQLDDIGHPAASIRYLGISHMHSDHVGNVDLLPQAVLLMQKEEYAAAFGPDPGKYGFDPATYATLRANPQKQLDGDYDVFGDGSVIVKRMPGHTPGHQALYVKLPHSGNILLSGDLVHYADNWIHKRVPAFNFDKEQSLKTMEETERFLEANQATLWIQHDREQNAALKHAPAYYD